MKTRLMLLSGFVVVLVLLSTTTFSAVSSSKKDKPDSKTPTIALLRLPNFEKSWFSEIKTALDKAGYTTKVISNDKDLKGDGIDIGIALCSHIGTKEIHPFVYVSHNENNLVAKCIEKKLARRIKLTTDVLNVEYVHFLHAGDPIILITVERTDIEKYCDRYAQGIVEGIEEYMDELD